MSNQPSSPVPSRACEGGTVGVGLVILFIAFALRWPGFQDSLWLDELHTAWCVSGSWNEVLPRCAIGNQSPLYFHMLRFFVRSVGASELSLRVPSLLAGLGLVAVIGWEARWLTRSTWAGLFAAFLVAVDRNCIFYSQEARPYAILQCIAWIHVLIGWQLMKQPGPVLRLAFVGLAILQFYLHYTAGLFLGAELALLVVLRRRGSAYDWRRLMIDVAVIVVACLPTAWHLVEIGSRRQLWEQFVFPPSGADFARLLRLDVYGFFPLMALAAAWIGSGCRNLARATESKVEGNGHPLDWPSSIGSVASLLLIPATVAWSTTRWKIAALFLGRYLVSSFAGAPLAAALLIRLIPLPRMQVFVATGVAVASLWTSGMWQQWQRDGRLVGDRQQDWRGAVAFVNREAADSEDIGLVRSGFVEADRLRTEADARLVDYCLAPVNSLYRLRIPAVPLPTSLVAHGEHSTGETTLAKDVIVAFRRDPAHDIWLIFNGSEGSRRQISADLKEALHQESPAAAIKRCQEFGDVLVCQIGRRQPTSPNSIPAP